MKKEIGMKFLVIAATVAASLIATQAAAQSHRVVTLSDGSTVEFANNREGGFFRSQEAQSLQFHCNPQCTLIGNTASSTPGFVPGLLSRAIDGFSIVRAAEVLRPSETYVSNYADGGNARSDAEADADSWSESRPNVDVVTDVNVDVRTTSPTLPPTPPTPPGPCCSPPGPPPPPPPPPPPAWFNN